MGRNKENYTEWSKKTLVNLGLKLNRENDKDVIDYLENVPNKRQYIIELIRKDMKEKALSI